MGAKESDDLYTKLEEIDDGKGYNEEIKRFEEGDKVLKEFCERNNSSEETSQRKDNVVGKKIQMFSLQHSSISEVYSSSSLTKEDIRNTDPAASKLSQLHSSESGFVRANSIALDPSKTAQRLKIAMLVVGTRGDVQPFLAEFGHHVRLATHINFSNFVKAAGVEFYPLGGDPRVLAGYMARNKGLPSAAGELSIQRKQLKAIMESILPACTEPDVKTGAPFTAQAIIANPPAY
ncbi:Sterol 3-beta-glucosyltransferase UGT80B1, partial [Bienertia sinuspersici]